MIGLGLRHDVRGKLDWGKSIAYSMDCGLNVVRNLMQETRIVVQLTQANKR